MQWSKTGNGAPVAKAESNGSAEPEGLSKLDEIREKASKSISNFRSLLTAMRAPLPADTGDGSALPVEEKNNLSADIEALWRDLHILGIKDKENLIDVSLKGVLHEEWNDKEYRMERLIQAAAILPDDVVSKKITGNFVTQLWNDLEHPPQTLLSEEYQFRQPDGSKNCYQDPQIGAAGMAYARTVAPKGLQSGYMPDPGVLFDTVMARKDPAGKEHPNKISSMLFYLASIIIHDIFKTNRFDYNISDTSSYLDLSPLYGSNWQEQKRMRTFQDGKLKPDCFSETRLLTFPPGVGAVLIMFNRYHNYIAEQLALINEDGRFTEAPRKTTVERYGEELNKREDDIFQTARLITCGLYVNMILIDYVRTILNLNKTDEDWQLNPRMDIPDGPPVATGNQCAAEFNLVYRWHSAVSTGDDAWTRQLFKEIVEEPLGMTAAEAARPENLPKFLGVLGQLEAKAGALDPPDRPFPSLKNEQLERIKDGPRKGCFKDDDLASILTAGVEDVANAMGPQQVPVVMKAIEILGIRQARTWRVATLNEFRKHFALEPHRKFSDITDNVEVQEALKHLYDTPDNVELYPGLVVEDAKKPIVPGSGLCPSYTTSRGVLSDAVALVRGDRFFTTSYNPGALTNWGFQEASSDPTIDNGCVFYKLFLRALPYNFDPASVYVHYPMTIPSEMQLVLKRLGKAHKYDFKRPEPIPQPTVIFSYDAVKQILDDQENFKVTWGTALQFLMGDEAKTFMLAGDDKKNAASRKLMEQALYKGGSSREPPKGNEEWLKTVREFYEAITTQLLNEKSYSLAGVKQVDIIRDVGNMAHVHFGAALFSLPLKTIDNPLGVFTEKQLYLVMAAVFICVFFDMDPPKSFPLRLKAYEATQQLGDLVEWITTAVKATNKLPVKLDKLVDYAAKNSSPAASHSPKVKGYGLHMISQLVKEQPDVKNLVWGQIMGTVGGMVANQGQLFGQALDYFFTEGQQYLADINRLAKLDTPEADDVLLHYLLEASRLNGETGALRRVANPITITDSTVPLGKKVYNFKPNDRVLVNMKAASRDPIAFPNPDALVLTRPVESYIHLGHGPHACLGAPMTYAALTTMLKVVGRLDGLRPAPVAVGPNSTTSRVKKVLRNFDFEMPAEKISAPKVDTAVSGSKNADADVDGHGNVPESWHYHAFLTEDWDQFFPFPTSLQINWDTKIDKKT
ncbi:putative hem peroxidase superfamily, hem peroxidase, animal-type, cytochrome P450 superfamily [Acrodontium crateriforme]|uniref:Hem peroxidase superfamily, hem peroxidase, animal-type, cytochrome P450 superfamily n=1 Tax=Acrodontium crateriforme TaxID=150365 RepID=A0AAQ3RCH3_9PEZI|nr:putative hem peroxidase superfamily, hem peroxidase, animal-type, cytochrome P450 superfamily [Acrodontium crateriforme]